MATVGFAGGLGQGGGVEAFVETGVPPPAARHADTAGSGRGLLWDSSSACGASPGLVRLAEARTGAEARWSPQSPLSPKPMGAAPRGGIYYMHVHKAGGSTLCGLAAQNGLQVSLSSNCLELTKGPAGEDVHLAWWDWRAEEQEKLFLTTRSEFVANEDHPFQRAPLPGAVIYVITVRNPLDRVLSHFRHHRKDKKLTNYSFPEFVFKEPLEFWAMNWFTQLLGNCYSGQRCSEAHLQRAIGNLEYFSLVLITDSSLEYRLGAEMLGARLGWRQTNPNSQRRGTRVQSRAATELQSHPEAYLRLLQLNHLDVAFYDAAKVQPRASLEEQPTGMVHSQLCARCTCCAKGFCTHGPRSRTCRRYSSVSFFRMRSS
uniref:Sulfotransferase n=2 Tax=Rhizochromulina marina TaxID=1034831 RepID=A0A7S2RMP1_9STRA|mmetsp:Transcript_18406/g.53785  ORF Transcript_18406/g.53785 Transcript_18406/m.53785 type:complete len:373 (+) Transcript_18406:123-1241(+)